MKNAIDRLEQAEAAVLHHIEGVVEDLQKIEESQERRVDSTRQIRN